MAETTIDGGICPEQQLLLDELYVLAKKLNAVAGRVRAAVENNNFADLTSSKREFDKIRDEIVRRAQRIALHRAEHRC
jgi:hypothetical protein